ncbi:MAG: uracil phosphoribosyltransferase [Saprospiraceae bacterium]|nr:uracil phosphoribosyltransferase [Saprospiraceae bacterium]
MPLVNLSLSPTMVNRFVAQLRDVTVQHDRQRFRHNMERIGEVMAYEISKTLDYQNIDIKTPLASTTALVPARRVVLATILRAGLPLHQGLLRHFDDADNTFISAYRHHPDDSPHFEIRLEYLSTPRLDDAVLILADPMLATGASILATLKALKKYGTPAAIHLVCAIASQPGVETIQAAHPDVHIWAAAVDPILDGRSYIVPGLGDAGDLSFGIKI